MNRDQAYKLIIEMIQSQNLIRHALAVEAIMRALNQYLKKKYPDLPQEEFDEEEWGLVGLLHDADYEIVKEDLSRHTLVTEEKIRPLGASERIITGIKAHHKELKGNRETYLEKAIFAADELSGLIVATSLVQPDKKISSVTVDSVLKKFKEKSFAAGVHRENILTCETELGIPSPDFIGIALKAMQQKASELGL